MVVRKKMFRDLVGLERFVCLSTGLRCSLKRSLSRRFVSSYHAITFLELQSI